MAGWNSLPRGTNRLAGWDRSWGGTTSRHGRSLSDLGRSLSDRSRSLSDWGRSLSDRGRSSGWSLGWLAGCEGRERLLLESLLSGQRGRSDGLVKLLAAELVGQLDRSLRLGAVTSGTVLHHKVVLILADNIAGTNLLQ